ncbi:MAG: acyl carrier protein [Bdellovibrionales bacterium]|nr:acyl carrier protein [Bdellovibrionales bacterium]
MGNNNEVFSNLQTAIRDVLNTPGLEVKPESTLFDDLGLESIDLLDLSCDLEKSLGRELDFKKIIQHVTKTRGVTPKQVQVQDVVAFINSEA